MFAPIMTKWYQLLNRLQFNTPTKALVYRVRPVRVAGERRDRSGVDPFPSRYTWIKPFSVLLLSHSFLGV